MRDEKKLRYFDKVFDIFSSGKEGRYTFWSDYTEDDVFWSADMVDFFDLPAQHMKNEHALEAWMELIHPDDLERYVVEVNKMCTDPEGRFDVTHRVRTKSGDYVTVTTVGRLIRDEKGEEDFFTGSIINHTIMDIVDPTTGLFNRDKLILDMRGRAKEKKPYYLVMVGVRNFFTINNAYGYETGNHVLQEIANRALARKGQNGSVYRIDGVKIVFLLDGDKVSEEEVNILYKNLRDSLREGVDVDGCHISIEICAGAVYTRDNDLDVNAVFNSAQYAISIAKDNNMRDLCFYDNELLSSKRDHIRTLAVIRRSVAEECRGFFLCYQPIIDAETESISGMEALLRWRNNNGDIVPPNSFVPWLEQDPIFYELGNWIIRRAIDDSWELIEQQPDFLVNINLAYPQLQRDDFNARLNEILKDTGFPARNLKMELTERCRLLDIDMLRNEMIFFKSSGMQTALDDFGTGYSALSLLINLPVDQIKIDKSFIDDIEKDIPKQSLLRAITTCARELGKSICVEGIETLEMKEYIKENFPVTNFQGYYYAKPMPIEDFKRWASEYRRG
ncbi:MAG: GGDEF and EAL domain-containing protein [Lachnospiraceae bacterium]|nr:GGDEF and EAL domain-containing protein [Lachnospiraceae bacterium]